MRAGIQGAMAFGAGIALAAIVAGVIVWARDNGGSGPSAAPSQSDYAKLFANAVVGRSTIAVLDKWPSPPYQVYKAPLSKTQIDKCYEWYDKPVALYNLCFNSKDVLDSKEIE